MKKKIWCALNFPVLFKIPLEILSIYKLCSCLECIFIYTHSYVCVCVSVCVCVCVCIYIYSRFKMESYSCHSIFNFFFLISFIFNSIHGNKINSSYGSEGYKFNNVFNNSGVFLIKILNYFYLCTNMQLFYKKLMKIINTQKI